MIEDGVRMILTGLGENVHRRGIKDTPARVAKLYDDVLDGQYTRLKEQTSFTGETYGGTIMVHHVPFYAFCEHHLLPFYGHMGIAYIPDEEILGLSKLVRIFRHACKKITIQERITEEAVKLMVSIAQPKGVMCYVCAEHTCMSLRGVKSPGSKTTTFDYAGEYKTNVELRQQFLNEASK